MGGKRAKRRLFTGRPKRREKLAFGGTKKADRPRERRRPARKHQKRDTEGRKGQGFRRNYEGYSIS